MGGVTGTSDDRVARALLSFLAEPGDRRIGGLLRRHPAVDLVEMIRTGTSGLETEERYRVRLGSAKPEQHLDRVAEVGGRLLVPDDLEWPRQLDDLGASAPWALWVRGTLDLRLTALRSVAVVGARASTALRRARRVPARGPTSPRPGGPWCPAVPSASTRRRTSGALAAHGLTVAVLACGVDLAYPPSHDALFARIAADGLVVSEVPPGSAPHRTRFLVRNRVIAALTRGTVVVEAALRSGSLSTAHEAERLRRPVMGVPGPVTSEQSRGVHRLLRNGALLVTSAAEVIEAVGGIGVDLAPEPSGRVDPRDALDPLASRVLDAVPVRRAVTLESVARTAGVTPAETSAALSLLELAGFVRRGPDGWALTRTAGRPSGAPG